MKPRIAITLDSGNIINITTNIDMDILLIDKDIEAYSLSERTDVDGEDAKIKNPGIDLISESAVNKLFKYKDAETYNRECLKCGHIYVGEPGDTCPECQSTDTSDLEN